MGRRREHDEATGVVLLDAAEELLVSGGIDAVAVRPVADRADTTVRAVYSVFGSKDGLLEALAERGYQRLADLVNGLPVTDDPVVDLVAVGVDGFRRFAFEHTELFRLTFERVPRQAVSRRSQRAALQSYLALTGRIDAAKATGALADRPTIEVAFAFHSLCLGLATSELSREPPPVGVGLWGNTEGIDGAHLWRTSLEALLTGFRA